MTSHPSAESEAVAPRPVTTRPLPAPTKVFAAGERHPGLRAPLREIALRPTAGEPPLRVCDASGSYTDPDQTIDLNRGRGARPGSRGGATSRPMRAAA